MAKYTILATHSGTFARIAQVVEGSKEQAFTIAEHLLSHQGYGNIHVKGPQNFSLIYNQNLQRWEWRRDRRGVT